MSSLLDQISEVANTLEKGSLDHFLTLQRLFVKHLVACVRCSTDVADRHVSCWIMLQHKTFTVIESIRNTVKKDSIVWSFRVGSNVQCLFLKLVACIRRSPNVADQHVGCWCYYYSGAHM